MNVKPFTYDQGRGRYHETINWFPMEAAMTQTIISVAQNSAKAFFGFVSAMLEPDMFRLAPTRQLDLATSRLTGGGLRA
jgi:hypothetical protein